MGVRENRTALLGQRRFLFALFYCVILQLKCLPSALESSAFSVQTLAFNPGGCFAVVLELLFFFKGNVWLVLWVCRHIHEVLFLLYPLETNGLGDRQDRGCKAQTW